MLRGNSEQSVNSAAADNRPLLNTENHQCHHPQSYLVIEGKVIEDSGAMSAGDLHTIDAGWESLDYDVCENAQYRRKERSQTRFTRSTRDAWRWTSFMLIGIITGIISLVLEFAIEHLSDFKLDQLDKRIASVGNDFWKPGLEEDVFAPPILPSFVMWVTISAAYVTVAAIATLLIQPAAGGSGIPQLKAYLNGVRVNAFLGIDALMVKLFGTALSVASGLAVGQEGPMVHSGAIVASGVAEGTIRLSCFRRKPKNDSRTRKLSISSANTPQKSQCFSLCQCRDIKFSHYFSNDHDKRDFVSAGGAAGLAAAFGTPITGVLFALEEGASFWNHRLTMGLLLSSMTATFTVFVMGVLVATILPGTDHQTTNLLDKAVFALGNVADMSFDVAEIPLIVIVGFIGGISGALFNRLNKKIAEFRFHYLHHKFTLTLEPIVAAVILAAISFIMSFILVPSCSKWSFNAEDKQLLLPNKSPIHNCGEKAPKGRLTCIAGEYSTMSLLFLQTPEKAIRNLFLCDDPEQFDWITLSMFVFVYFLVTCWCCGISVPSGIFVPNFLVGAAWGRLLGYLFYQFYPATNEIKPGTYAVFGAAAQMAGVSHMTLTLTCMVAEGTGNVSFGLPVMIVCVIAKFVGEHLSEGIYEQYLQLMAVPFLSFDPPSKTSNIQIVDVATRPVVTLRVVEKMSRILDVVENTEHCGFPIVDDAAGPGQSGGLAGLLRRDQLIAILAQRQFASRLEDEEGYQTEVSSSRQRLNLSDLVLRPQELSQVVDLRPHMNPAPYAVLDQASLSKVFRLFRGLGLRHLVVVNRRNEVVGIVTRKDLAVWNEMAGDPHSQVAMPFSVGMNFH